MKAYIVSVEEVYIKQVKVFARTEGEARILVDEKGCGEVIEPSTYSYTLESDIWNVQEIGKQCEHCKGECVMPSESQKNVIEGVQMIKCNRCDGKGIECFSEYEISEEEQY